MTIIVTGGAGFIGSNFVFHMLNKFENKKINFLKKLEKIILFQKFILVLDMDVEKENMI